MQATLLMDKLANIREEYLDPITSCISSHARKCADAVPLEYRPYVPYAAGAVGAAAVYALIRKIAAGSTAKVKNVNLFGKVAIITGGNAGIGRETARALYLLGAHVIIACRSKAKAEEALDDITDEWSKPGGKIEFMELDLASLESVNNFVETFKARKLPLHLLINNAGLIRHFKKNPSTKQYEPESTKEGFEVMVGTNHLGHFLLTQKLLPVMAASEGNTEQDPGRIVILSSEAHFAVPNNTTFEQIKTRFVHTTESAKSGGGFFSTMQQYGLSKLLNLYHALELQHRIDQYNADSSSGKPKIHVVVNAAHPGGVRTNIFTADGRTSFIESLLMKPLAFLFFKTPKQGAQTTIHLAASPAAKKGGLYYKECKPSSFLSKVARDPEIARQVFDYSCQLVNIDPKQPLL